MCRTLIRTSRPAVGIRASPRHLPGVWLDVPFVRQEKDGCGAASIAMVMQYWQRQRAVAGASSDAAQIQHALYSSQGSRHLCFRHGTVLQGEWIPHVYNSRRVGRSQATSGQRASPNRRVETWGGTGLFTIPCTTW